MKEVKLSFECGLVEDEIEGCMSWVDVWIIPLSSEDQKELSPIEKTQRGAGKWLEIFQLSPGKYLIGLRELRGCKDSSAWALLTINEKGQINLRKLEGTTPFRISIH
jgi:hypothetical protein